MTNLDLLRAELDSGHPGTGAYSSDAQVAADQMNAVNRTRNKSLVSGDEAFSATEAAGFLGLTDAKRQLWLAFCGRDQIDPFASANVDFVKFIFGDPSPTLTALSAIRTEAVSRAQELNFHNVRPGTIDAARAL